MSVSSRAWRHRASVDARDRRCTGAAGGGPLEVTSPGGALVLRVRPGPTLTYEVTHRGRPIVLPSPIGLVLADGRTLGAPAVVARSAVRSVDDMLRPVLRVKRAELKLDLRNDRDEHVAARADYIAKTKGAREFPWRVLVMAERDATLIESDIVYRLAAETRLDDTSWIRPGKVAWDW